MEWQAWDANATAANWEGLWGTVAAPQVLPSTSSPLLPPPLQQHLGNFFFSASQVMPRLLLETTGAIRPVTRINSALPALVPGHGLPSAAALGARGSRREQAGVCTAGVVFA